MAAKKKAGELPVAILCRACEEDPASAFRVLRGAVEQAKAVAAECLAAGDADGANEALANLRAAEEGRELLTMIGGPEAVAVARKKLLAPAVASVAEEEPEPDDDEDDSSMGEPSDVDGEPGPEGGDRAAG